MNQHLIRKVAAYIEAHPQRHNQGNWVIAPRVNDRDYVKEGKTPAHVAREEIKERGFTRDSCSTTCCVAGWAAILADEPAFNRAVEHTLDTLGQYQYWGDGAWIRLGAELFGVEYEVAKRIFWDELGLERGELVAALRHLADTGELPPVLLNATPRPL